MRNILNGLIAGLSVKRVHKKDHAKFHRINILEFEELNSQILIIHFNFIFMSTVD